MVQILKKLNILIFNYYHISVISKVEVKFAVNEIKKKKRVKLHQRQHSAIINLPTASQVILINSLIVFYRSSTLLFLIAKLLFSTAHGDGLSLYNHRRAGTNYSGTACCGTAPDSANERAVDCVYRPPFSK